MVWKQIGLENQQQRPPKGRNVQRLNVLHLMNYIVYKTTNLINGKVYVGVHYTKNPDVFDGYIGCGVTKKDKKKKVSIGFPAAVRKYGYENFKRETLFIYPDTEAGMIAAFDKEAEIVNEEWVKSDKNYNITLGGRCTLYQRLKKKVSQYSLNGEFIKTWDSIREAAIELKIEESNITMCCSGKYKYSGGFQWRLYNGTQDAIDPVETKEKTVYQFDLQGNLLKVWKSSAEAAKTFENPNAAKNLIWQVCTDERKTRQAYGYYWSFKCKFEYVCPIKTTAVAKYNDAGEFLESYTSIKDAAEANNIKSSANINAAIRGTQKRCGGFRWRYYYGNNDNIKPL